MINLNIKNTDLAATPERFALIGAFDDAYAAYEEIYNLNEMIIEQNRADIREGRTNQQIDIFIIRDSLLSQYIQILNEFYEKQTSVFTKDYEKLSLNDETLNGICFCFGDRKEGLSPTGHLVYENKFKTISLLSFIRLLEYIAIDIIVNKVKLEA